MRVISSTQTPINYFPRARIFHEGYQGLIVRYFDFYHRPRLKVLINRDNKIPNNSELINTTGLKKIILQHI